MAPQSFYKQFGSSEISKEACSIFFSHCHRNSKKLRATYSLIHNLNDPNIGVLLPVYHETTTGNLADTQLSITGSVKKGEFFKHALIREVREELGLNINSFSYIGSETIHGTNRNIRLVTYVCHYTGSELSCLERPDIEPNALLEDDETRKIQIVIYGKIDDIHNLISRIEYRPPASDNLVVDQAYTIGGLRIVPYRYLGFLTKRVKCDTQVKNTRIPDAILDEPNKIRLLKKLLRALGVSF